VEICDSWLNFENFKNWAERNGYTDELTIDRIDVNGNYEPNNCRWVDRKIQQRNQQKLRKNNTTGYRGVSKHQKGFIVQITVSNKNKYLGVTNTAEDGALLYDCYIIKNNLEHTKNFEYSTDAIGFIQQVDQVDFRTAVEIVGGFVNLRVA
jgi:hypothetical protein